MLSHYDDTILSQLDKWRIKRLKRSYVVHRDKNAHRVAERIRAKYGYSGGVDGNEGIRLGRDIVTIKEKILNDYVIEKAVSMRVKVINNINKEVIEKVEMGYPQSKMQEILDLREKLLKTDLEEFMNLDFEDLSYYTM